MPDMRRQRTASTLMLGFDEAERAGSAPERRHAGGPVRRRRASTPATIPLGSARVGSRRSPRCRRSRPRGPGTATSRPARSRTTPARHRRPTRSGASAPSATRRAAEHRARPARDLPTGSLPCVLLIPYGCSFRTSVLISGPAGETRQPTGRRDVPSRTGAPRYRGCGSAGAREECRAPQAAVEPILKDPALPLDPVDSREDVLFPLFELLDQSWDTTCETTAGVSLPCDPVGGRTHAGGEAAVAATP